MLDQIRVVTYFGDERYYKYVVSTSTDDLTFTPVYTKYDESLSTSEGITFTLQGVTARYVRVTILENSSSWGSVHLNELEVYGRETDHEEENIAAGKQVSASGCAEGYSAAAAVDGNYLSAWQGISATDALTIDLGSVYRLDDIALFTESEGTFSYQISTGRNEADLDVVAQGKACSAEKISLNKAVGRYVRLSIADEEGPIPLYEVHVAGSMMESAEDGDIAYQKPVRANSSNTFASVITDHNTDTVWIARYYPCYVDIDLMENYDVHQLKVQVKNTSGYYRLSVYASKDGSRFDRVLSNAQKVRPDAEGFMTFDLTGAEDVRIIRVQFEYNSASSNIDVAQIRMYGEKCETAIEEKEELAYVAYEESGYAGEITDEEVLENVDALIARNFGEEYTDWFIFSLENKEAENDYFEIRDEEGKIHISGNKGLSLTTQVCIIT